MTASLPRVHVVMATYEPRTDWLHEQIVSVMAQEAVAVTLHLSDDGSGPDVLDLLSALCNSDDRMTWETGPRVGSSLNFARGLARAPRDVATIMLSDQDDIWAADKAMRSLATLDEGHVLVHGDATLIDADGARMQGTLFSVEGRDPTRTTQSDLIVVNVVTGCTIAMRPRLLAAALPFPGIVGQSIHHDLWLALCAAGSGTIGLVPGTLLAYRQHRGNVVGAVTDYGRWTGLRDAAGSWALRLRIAHAVVDVAAAGRIPPPGPDVHRWTGRLPELATWQLLRGGRGTGRSHELALVLRAGALARLATRSLRAPAVRLRRASILTGRLLRLVGHVIRHPKRMLGGIARNAGIIDRPLRVVSPTAHDPQLRPLHARITESPRTVHMLIPGISPSGVFGGVATAVALGVALARSGERVQFVLTDYGQSLDLATIRRTILRHVDTDAAVLDRIAIARAIHDDEVLALGRDDVLVATAWWTAFRAAATIASHTALQRRRFVYLIQDDEALFYPSSERRQMAEHSYRLASVPVVNSSPLAAHLLEHYGITVPDERVFAPVVGVREPLALRAPSEPLRIVVYGRPSVGRNLFEPALRGIAMWDAARRSGGDRTPIDLVSVGEPEQFRYRIGESMLRSPGVLDWDGYLALLRTAHIGVSLMASPHPSYPPLEMAMSGMAVVTNRWGPKDLGSVSARFISCDPDAAGVAAALSTARSLLDSGDVPGPDLTMLGSTLERTAAALCGIIADPTGLSRPA